MESVLPLRGIMEGTEHAIEKNGWLIVHDPSAAERWIATDSPVAVVD